MLVVEAGEMEARRAAGMRELKVASEIAEIDKAALTRLQAYTAAVGCEHTAREWPQRRDAERWGERVVQDRVDC